MKNKIIDNIKTIFYALIIALIIRSFLFQPFYIPSSSMEPNLLIGDRLFVSKYTYGYSRHSLPFSPKIYNNRILGDTPERGDVIVFKTPADNRTDYIKRLIGLPGDVIQIVDEDLYWGGRPVDGDWNDFSVDDSAPITNEDEADDNLILNIDYNQKTTDDIFDKTDINKINYSQDFQVALDKNLRLKIDDFIIPDIIEKNRKEQAY